MRAAVVGSMNIDKVAIVDHIPLKGETLMAKDYMETYGGKGANQAVALARLGGDVTMIGCVGRDSDGDRVIEHMRNEGVCMDHVGQIEAMPTGRAFINVGEQDNAIVVVPGANGQVTVDYLKGKGPILEQMDLLILQNEIPMAAVEYVLNTYGDAKGIIYNPAPYGPISPQALEKATWITPNETESIGLFQLVARERIIDRCIITMGRDGALYRDNGEEVTIPATRCEPVDTTGAGDTFNGALAYGLMTGMSPVAAIRFANTAAAISTEGTGAQEGMPGLEEVNERLLR